MCSKWMISTLGTCAVMLLLQLPVSSACGRGAIYLEDNQYRQMLVAISEAVPEDQRLIDRIKEVFREASLTLFKATRYRAMFGDITILIPKTWSHNTSYQPVTNETFETSDIVVDVPDPTSGEGHKPFVIKSTPCGELGYYMHLTPEYLLDESIAKEFGPYDKVLVHEWAHLRYGVYDEYTTEAEGDHFYVASAGSVEATRCSAEIKGKWIDAGSGKSCQWTSGKPGYGCRFVPEETGGSKYGSLMYAQYLSQVTEFCDDDADDKLSHHNRESPNQQNRMCGGRSVWEVMRSHADFANNANTELDPEEYREPTFRVVRADIKRTCLVLDVSGSMNDDQKIQKQNQGCSNFLGTIVEDGEKVGIVQFEASAKELAPMTVVGGDTRDWLVSKLPRKAKGGTSIGNGILKALEVLRKDGGTEGAALLIVSDGKETTGKRIADVWDTVMESGVTVHTIAFTGEADNKMDSLAQATGGLAFLYSGAGTSNALNDAFEAIGGINNNPRSRSYTIYSEALTLSGRQLLEGQTTVDATLGRDTEFLFDFVSAIDLLLESPSGSTFTANSPECLVDNDIRTIHCKFSGISEVGQWKYNVTNNDNRNQRLAITVKSKSRDDQEYPIIAHAFWGLHQLDVTVPGAEIQRLYASVSKGHVAVLNAQVTAEVETPTSPVTVTLLDNGAGADLTKDDGVYSAYFTHITGDGRYNVKVTVNSDAATVISPQYIVGRGAAHPIIRERRDAVTPTGDFQRSASGGVFQIVNYPTNAPDKLYAPGQITDLRILNDDGEVLSLQWTATGDQLDSGQASMYEIQVAGSYNFSEYNYTILGQSDVMNEANLSSPKSANEVEMFQVKLPDSEMSSYYLAVVAIDNNRDNPASSPRSNVVMWTKFVYSGRSYVGTIVGAVFGILVLLIAVALGTWSYMEWKKQNQPTEFVSTATEYPRSTKEKMDSESTKEDESGVYENVAFQPEKQ